MLWRYPEVALGGIAMLVGLQLVVSVASWVLLRLSSRSAALRVVALLLLAVAYHVAVAWLFDRRTVRTMDILFYWLHFGYVFRMLSSIYWFGRRPRTVPSFGFHLALLTLGARQHYGAGSWKELGGERISLDLLRRWTLHLGHLLVVAACAAGLIKLALSLEFPDRQVTLAAVPSLIAELPADAWAKILVVGASAIIGLQVLTLIADLHSLAWSLAGHHGGFFGRFPFFRSKHLGQFWQNWNVLAIRAFYELTGMLHLRRHPFLNTMAIFLVSGLLHQVTVFYYTRHVGYWTVVAFLLHGLAVYGFGVLYRHRFGMPAVLRAVVFNPIAMLAVALPISLPMALDFY